MSNPYLDIQNLTKTFGAQLLFNKISFSIAEGQKVGLIAQNGKGKSTLLSIIADRLGILVWQPTKDGHKNRNRPKSILQILTGEDKKKDELEVFDNPESFDEWYKRTRT